MTLPKIIFLVLVWWLTKSIVVDNLSEPFHSCCHLHKFETPHHFDISFMISWILHCQNLKRVTSHHTCNWFPKFHDMTVQRACHTWYQIHKSNSNVTTSARTNYDYTVRWLNCKTDGWLKALLRKIQIICVHDKKHG